MQDWIEGRPYREHPGLFDITGPLLDAVFPGVTRRMSDARPLGLRWEECSTPFVIFDGSTPVSHVGVLEMTLVLDGEEVPVGVIHGVGTHPDHRGRGHFRRAMEAALAWCDDRYDTLVLNTAIPSAYERFGFRTLAEQRFMSTATGVCDGPIARRLDFSSPADREVLGRLLRSRVPVSSVVGVVLEVHAFAFNELDRAPWYVEELDLLVSAERDDDTLRLFDWIGARTPSLADLLATVHPRATTVEAYFDALPLGGSWRAEPHVLAGDENLMARGSFPPEGKAFMLPRPARC